MQAWEGTRSRRTVEREDELTRTVVAEMAVEDRSQHQGFMHKRANALLVCLNANHAVLGERARTYMRQVSTPFNVKIEGKTASVHDVGPNLCPVA